MDETSSSTDIKSLEHRMGAVDYRFQVSALSFHDYMRMQGVLLRPAMRRPGVRGWIPWVLWLAAGAVVGCAAAAYELTAELWVGASTSEGGWLFGGRAVVLLGLCLFVIGCASYMVHVHRLQHRMMRTLHTAGREMFGSHEMVFGDGGVMLHNEVRSLIVPWSAITGVVPDKHVTFLVADHVSAFWLHEAALAALPDRAAFMAYLEQRMADNPSATGGAS